METKALDSTGSIHAADPAVASAVTPPKLTSRLRNWSGLVVTLFKLRIVFLLLVAATGGAFLAAGGWPGPGPLLLVWITGGASAAGASALNQWWEREADSRMHRTRRRPLVTGQIKDPRWVPVAGLLLVLLPSLAVAAFNPALAAFLLLGAFIYVVVYTIWLKPRTILNIVIGGAAGSAAVLSGAAAAGPWQQPGPLVLAGILFLWTPFHFWSLAIMYRDDYGREGVPMLPVGISPRQASWWILLHSVACALSGLLLVFLPGLGLVYFVPVLAITTYLLWRNIQLVAVADRARAARFFVSSNLYLLVLLIAVCAGSVARI